MKTSRSRLSEFAADLGMRVIRDCAFTYAAKILTPLDDVLVPLLRANAVEDLISRSGVAGVIATPELAELVPKDLGLAISDAPLIVLDDLHRLLHATPRRLWTDFPSEIDPAAEIHPTAVVPVNNVRVGPRAQVRALAYVAERSILGADSCVHAGAIVGGDAYELVFRNDQQFLRPQSGGVELGRGVQIMSGSVVTRAAFGGATRLDDRTVLDANVVVSHDARVGQDVRVGGGAWIGGRVAIGDRASLGPGCVISNGLKVGADAKVSMGAVVTRDVADGAHVTGNFAIDHQRFLDNLRATR